MSIIPLELKYYVRTKGNIPIADWFDSLGDPQTLEIIYGRLTRIEKGLLGDCKWVAPGVFELRIDYGPGYRVYFGRIGQAIVLLLHGGDKSRQSKDIRVAQNYWLDYLRRSREEKDT